MNLSTSVAHTLHVFLLQEAAQHKVIVEISIEDWHTSPSRDVKKKIAAFNIQYHKHSFMMKKDNREYSVDKIFFSITREYCSKEVKQYKKFLP